MKDEDILVSNVPRALEMKSKLFGYELPDLLFIFFNLAFTNFLFGGTSFRYPLVWGSTLGLAALLFFAKRGKPDSYLQHLGEYYVSPSYRSAGSSDRSFREFHFKEEIR